MRDPSLSSQPEKGGKDLENPSIGAFHHFGINPGKRENHTERQIADCCRQKPSLAIKGNHEEIDFCKITYIISLFVTPPVDTSTIQSR
jgi:hypothetical protein